MTREQAQRRYRALQRMTVARGCTPAEEATAARLARVLAAKYELEPAEEPATWRVAFDERFARAEWRAAVRFHWEYRRCGKARCRCAARGAKGHGPYRYSKRRKGRKVVSVYWGR